MILVQGQTMITLPAWRNDAQAAKGGVGLLIRQKARKSMISAKPITNISLIANLQSYLVTTVIDTSTIPWRLKQASKQYNGYIYATTTKIDSKHKFDPFGKIGDIY